MKRKVMIASLVATLAGGAMYALADPGHRPDSPPPMAEIDCGPDMPPPPDGPRGGGKHGRPGQFLARMARELGLSDAQKQQIKGILKAEFEKNAPIRQSLAENRKLLRQAGRSATFDETAVRALAANQSNNQTELTVSHVRVQSRIYALLTPEQRVKADALESKMEQRLRKGPRSSQDGV